ncbi:MAG: radical SAM protein [Armatimonadetes bacterium]|nr:radical SAM protein [Armatimonadota bacterium]
MPDLTRTLAVTEFFLSLQGEGSRVGRVCAFVRLAGCNLSCVWCDTTYAWKAGEMDPPVRHSLAAILAQVAQMGTSLVEVTGGEPLGQPATPDLLTALCDAGYEVVLNTSGSLGVNNIDERVHVALDLKCPASGQSERMDLSNLARLVAGRDEVKFVIADRGDYDWAVGLCVEHGLFDRVPVGFSPVTPAAFRGDMASWPLPGQLAAWMLADRCPATLGLQQHRLLWPAAVKGTQENAA